MRLHLCALQLAALLAVCLGELRLAVVVFRHGHRNIMRPYSFDPYSNASYWPGGIGELSNRGKMQMYQFGQRLRERYSDLLSDQFVSEETLMRSSSNPRCVSSALCVLAGLFPPTGDEVWNPVLPWQPVPVYADRKPLYNLLQPYAECPAYWQEYKSQMNSSEIQAFNTNYSDVYSIISEHWKPVHDFNEPFNLHDHFKVEEDRGFTLPNWTEGIYPDKLREISITYQQFRIHSPLMLRLKMGPLVKDIVERMKAIRDGSTRRRRKLLLYSGHDDNITGLLAALRLPNRFVVQYGAAIFLELHRDQPSDSKHYVKVYFMSDTDLNDIQEKQVAGCEQQCDLDSFAGILAPVMPSNLEKECQLNSTSAS